METASKSPLGSSVDSSRCTSCHNRRTEWSIENVMLSFAGSNWGSTLERLGLICLDRVYACGFRSCLKELFISLSVLHVKIWNERRFCFFRRKMIVLPKWTLSKIGTLLLEWDEIIPIVIAFVWCGLFRWKRRRRQRRVHIFFPPSELARTLKL